MFRSGSVDMFLGVPLQAKTSRGAGCVLPSTRPPAVEPRGTPAEGGLGGGCLTELFTMTVRSLGIGSVGSPGCRRGVTSESPRWALVLESA